MTDLVKWPVVRLAELAAPGKGSIAGGPFGSDLVSSDYVPEGVPVIRGVNLPKDKRLSVEGLVFVSEAKADSLHLNCAHAGDLIFTQRGTLGQVGLIPSDSPYPRFLISQSQMKMTVDREKADPLYLYHYFRLPSTVQYIENHALQAGVPHINLGILRKLEIVAPPMELQRKIAAILSVYEDLIANNQRRIALLEGMADEIYREWFIRKRFPGAAATAIIKGVPLGWKVEKLPVVANITYGFPFAGDRFNDVGLGKPIVRIRDVPRGTSDFFTDQIGPEKCVVKAGDFLVGMDGEFHMNHWAGGESWLVQRVCKIAAKEERLRAYLALALRAPIKHYEQTIVGATVGHLGAKHLTAIDILIPPESLTEGLYGLNSLLDQKIALARQCLLLADLRDALLPRLISGKLKLDHLDIRLPPSMQAEAEATA
jgi:type I restriction enzyme, S subunit